MWDIIFLSCRHLKHYRFPIPHGLGILDIILDIHHWCPGVIPWKDHYNYKYGYLASVGL